VAGDLHDIGKNLVRLMAEGAGFEVIDLGVDVTVERFVQAVDEHHPHVLMISALLTTTLVNMRETVKAVHTSHPQVVTMVGGAPVTPAFAREIEADGYADNAGAAARLALELVGTAGEKDA
jgi:methanogenic corrinoid protein MtbC1